MKVQFSKNDLVSIDRRVGERIRFARRNAGMTQKDVGVALSTSYQHVQKYEKGLHSIQGAKLYALAALFDVSVEFFFEGINKTLAPADVADEASAPLLLQATPQKAHLIKLICRANDDDIEALTSLARHMIRKQPVEESRANLLVLPKQARSN